MSIIRNRLPQLRNSLAIAALAALLGACLNDARPTTTAPMALTSSEGVASLRGSGPGYTRHDPLAQQAEIMAIRLGPGFEIGERAKILRAVNEWNHALNGLVRLEIVPSPGDAMPMQAGTGTPFGRIWTIAPLRGSAPSRGQLTSHALAVTQALPSGGGIVVVHVDRIGHRDIGAVLRHEIGHMLGLGHEPGSKLMATHYVGDNQACIDKATIAALAANRKLPLSSFNWCEG
jgi:hypothetical protein